MTDDRIKDFSVVYSSTTGNTKLLAETAANHLGKERCVYLGGPDGDVPASDLIVAGFWTDKGTCSEDMGRFLKGLRDKKVFLFGTAGFGGDEEYFGRILAGVKSILDASVQVVGTYMCQGRMPQMVRRKYEAMDDNDPSVPKKMLLDNFDRAMTHPDADDLGALKDALDQMRKHVQGGAHKDNTNIR